MRKIAVLLLTVCTIMTLCVPVLPSGAFKGVQVKADEYDADALSFDFSLVDKDGEQNDLTEGDCIPSSYYIDLNGKRTFSGVRLYSPMDKAGTVGQVTGVKVYVKYEGDESYHFIQSGGAERENDTDTDIKTFDERFDIEIKFLQNISAESVRVDIVSSNAAFFFVENIAVLKEDASLEKTWESYSDTDEIDVFAENVYSGNNAGGFYGGAMDGDFGTSSFADRKLHLMFGREVTFSGYRYYPPKSNPENAAQTMYSTSIITGNVELDANGKVISSDKTSLGNQTLEYNNSDYSDPVTVSFGKNVTGTGLYLNSWTGFVSGTPGWHANVKIGEIKLLKPIDYSGGYIDGEKVINPSNASVISFGSTEGSVSGKDASSLFDGVIYKSDKETEPASAPYFGWNDAGLDKEENSAYFTVDLGSEYTFSAVRLFARMGFPDQAVREGKIYYSDDGERWTNGYTGLFPDDGKMPSSEYTDSIRYKESGDIYCDFKADGNANVKARYIKIEINKTGGNGFGAQELALLAPDEDMPTLSVSELGLKRTEGEYLTEDILLSYSAGSAWGDSHPVDSLFDGITDGTAGNYWHSDVKTGATDEDRTVTAIFKSATEIGGVRVYPRTDDSGKYGNPGIVSIEGSYDGVNYIKVLSGYRIEQAIPPEKIENGVYYDVLLNKSGDNKFKAIKFIVEKNAGLAANYTCFTELAFLEPVSPEISFLEDDFSSYPEWSLSSGSVGSDNTFSSGALEKMTDGVILDEDFYDKLCQTGQQWYNHAELSGAVMPDGGKYTYIIIDLGREIESSGVRVYNRWNFFEWQAISKGRLYASSDGVNWTEGDITGTAGIPGRYTDILFSFGGKRANIATRYIKLDCIEIGGAAYKTVWALEELRLILPKEENPTVNADSIALLYREQTENVEKLISEIGTVTKDSFNKIAAAREAYDALPEIAKKAVGNVEELIEAEKKYRELSVSAANEAIEKLPDPDDVTISDVDMIEEAERLYNAVPDELRGNVDDVEKLENVKNALSRIRVTVTADSEGLLLGLKTVQFILKAPGNKIVNKLIYNGEEYTQGGYFEQKRDGENIILTVTGKYDYTDYASWGPLTVGGYLKDGVKIYSASDYEKYGMAKGEEIVLGSGKLVNSIVNDNPLSGDHIITAVFSDGSEKNISINSVMTWENVKQPDKNAKDDELTPSSEWKVTATAGTGKLGALVSASDEDYWETGFLDGRYSTDQSEAAQGNGKYDIIFWGARPFNVYIDMGKDKTPYKGIRFYPRKNMESSNAGKVKIFLSDDGTVWEDFGEYQLSQSDSVPEIMITDKDEGINRRYIRIMIEEAMSKIPTSISIAEIALVKPVAKVNGSDTVTVDKDNSISGEARFSIDMGLAKSVTEAVCGAVIDEKYYRLEDSQVIFGAEFIRSLPEGRTDITLKLDTGEELVVHIVRKDTLEIHYELTGYESRGTENLTLISPRYETPKKVTVDGREMEFSMTGNEVVILRKDFRRAFDTYGAYESGREVAAEICFDDKSTVSYSIRFDNYRYTFGDYEVNEEAFSADEYIPDDRWGIEVSTTNETSDLRRLISGAETKLYTWHSGYSLNSGSPISDTAGEKYIVLDMGKEQVTEGIRYYSRNDMLS